MIKVVLEGKPKPKPAGCIKYTRGRAYISMDVRGYSKWKAKHVKDLQNIPKGIKAYGIVYNVIVPNRFQLGDLTNITNAVQDIMVDAEILKDDNSKHVNKVYEVLTISKDIDYAVEVYFCQSKSEFGLVVNRFL